MNIVGSTSMGSLPNILVTTTSKRFVTMPKDSITKVFMLFLTFTGLMMAVEVLMDNSPCQIMITQYHSGKNLQTILRTCPMSCLTFTMNHIPTIWVEVMMMHGSAGEMVAGALELVTRSLVCRS